MITLRHTTAVGLLWTSVQSDVRRDLYITTHKTHKRETSMTRAGFEPAIPVRG